MSPEKALAGAEILGLGLVSPAGNTLEEVLAAVDGKPLKPAEPVSKDCPELENIFGYSCAFPEAKECLGAGRLRRLGPLLIMSLLAARKACSDFDPEFSGRPQDSVFLGTGLGSLGDTQAFLENMIEHDERFPKPASFVNSVHNAAASQIAIELGLQGQNLTFTHRQTSLASALWAALRNLESGRGGYALVGGVDELNKYHLLAGAQKGLWKKGSQALQPLAATSSVSRGSLPGEGAAVCVLGPAGQLARGQKSYGRVRSVKVGRYFRNPRTYLDVSRTVDFIEDALVAAGQDVAGLDLLLSGANGDSRLDKVYRRVADELSRRAAGTGTGVVAHGTYKQFCGDYQTAEAFGFALAAMILRRGRVPGGLFLNPENQPPADHQVHRILLYSLSRFGTHSACVIER
jgi:3-oxoacyl-[acyl-carrier-protein] synthase II